MLYFQYFLRYYEAGASPLPTGEACSRWPSFSSLHYVEATSWGREETVWRSITYTVVHTMHIKVDLFQHWKKCNFSVHPGSSANTSFVGIQMFEKYSLPTQPPVSHEALRRFTTSLRAWRTSRYMYRDTHVSPPSSHHRMRPYTTKTKTSRWCTSCTLSDYRWCTTSST